MSDFDADHGADGPIRPDGVTPGGESGETGGAGTVGDALDTLANRAVDSVLHLVRRGTALAGGVLLFCAICSIGGFLLGLAALSGGMRTVWIVLGGFFMFLSISSVVRAILRLRTVRRSSGQLVAEIRSLIGRDQESRTTVRATVDSTESMSDGTITDLSREFFTMQGAVGGHAGQYRALASALSAVTTFPGLIALATLIAFVFAGLSLIFGVALLL